MYIDTPSRTVEKATFLNVMLPLKTILNASLIKIVATASYPKVSLVEAATTKC
jgi:hypothetical protein